MSSRSPLDASSDSSMDSSAQYQSDPVRNAKSATAPLVSKQPTPIVNQPGHSTPTVLTSIQPSHLPTSVASSSQSFPDSLPLSQSANMVPGYEDDYISRSPSPSGPPFSPLTPVIEYVHVSINAFLLLTDVLIVSFIRWRLL